MSFHVVYEPPVQPEQHWCDIPQSSHELAARGMQSPEPWTVIECDECGQRWVADYPGYQMAWSRQREPARRWWHRWTAEDEQ